MNCTCYCTVVGHVYLQLSDCIAMHCIQSDCCELYGANFTPSSSAKGYAKGNQKPIIVLDKCLIGASLAPCAH